MRLFPYRSSEEKKEEVKQGLWQVLFWFLLGVVCIATFVGSAYFQIAADGWLTYMPVICLVVGFFSIFCFFQAIFDLFIDATIGPERFLALFAVLALLAWLFG